MFFAVPVSTAAAALLAVGRGKGWWLATASSAISLAGWVVAYLTLTG